MPQSNVSNSRVPANERAEGVVMHRLALLFVASALWAAQPEPDDAQVWMKKGTEAFDSGHYAEAARDFEKAVARDPASMEARLNLATSYFEQYIPGAHTPNNLDMARKTEENFLKVLDFDAENKSATAYLARISFEEASAAVAPIERSEKYDQARDWYRKLAEIDPSEGEAFYNLALIDWVRACAQWKAIRAAAGMMPEDTRPLPASSRRALESTRALFDDGIRQLEKAMHIDSGDSDAMGYMSLILREKADLAAIPEDHQRQIDEADAWMRRSSKIRQEQAASQP